MSLSQQYMHTINQIVEQLNADERKRMSYLCGESDIERCASDAKVMLQSLVCQAEMDYVFLKELILRMRRFDLLKRVLGTSKDEVESLLKTRRSLPEYRVLMAELSEDVGSEDLESLVFLLRGTLPKEKLERFECFLDVVVELEKLDHISSTRMDVMEEYLRAIHRTDLARRLNQYQSRVKMRTPGKRVQNKDNLHSSKAASPDTSAQISPHFCSAKPVLSRLCASTSVRQKTLTIKPHEEHVYRMQRNPKGMCVIIDCVGTEGVHLKQGFEGLHFRVSLHHLLSAADMLAVLQQVSMQTEHHGADAFVCCLVSRTSSSSSLLGTDSHGLGLNLDLVRRLFAPDSCPGLAGKPKLFFIQGYDVSEPGGCAANWEYGSGELQTDGFRPVDSKTEDVPCDADIFWSHCWTQEQELANRGHQSVYLHSLRDALQGGQRRRIHLVDLHMDVNRAVYDHNHKHPRSSYHLSLRHTLRKNLYLS